MRTHLIPFPTHLEKHIECIRTVEHCHSERVAINVCLNGLPGIVFQHHNGHSPVEAITTRSAKRAAIPTLYVYGQMTEPGVMHYKRESFSTLQIVLKPHALQSLLGINASLLTNSVVDLAEFSGGDLNGQLLEAQSSQESVTRLVNFLAAKCEQVKTRDQLVEESLRIIHQNRGTTSVKSLLDLLSISERQFEKRFQQAVGVSPHFYMRVKRFHHALRLMKSGHFEKLTDVAYALNYYDQSHFIRDIKAFSGMTPTSLSQKVDDVHLDQKVIAYS